MSVKIIKNFLPPPEWQIPVIILVGVIVGTGLFIFRTSRAYSYLSDNPETCMNCHIMAPQFATWSHSSHRRVANCNDCHVPHNNIFNKYFFKAKDGLRHATIFTLRREPQVIFIRKAGINVVKGNCERCHEQQMSCMQCHRKFNDTGDEYTMSNREFSEYHSDRLCWDCHREVPHGRANSISSVPYARVPVPSSPVPEWMKRGSPSLKY
jgi:cytochrome c nitrite reductase small subunit